MILKLANETHPEAEVVSIHVKAHSVDFINKDGMNNAPLGELRLEIPSKIELTAAIEAVLGEAQ